ncbi:hypothetical protein C8J57DRAFT_1715010 [Mycena rebaudengoi]|nr:hypothetical protein C8J57DRAFT_1715010 [Mycena rebaudengoi]
MGKVVPFNAVLLISSWVNLMLYVLEIVLVAEYFRRRSARPFLHKLGVASFMLFDTICTMSVSSHVYLSVLAGDLNSRELLWSITFILLSTYATAAVEQIYMLNLYLALTKNRIIGAFLLALVVVHTAFSFASAALIQVQNTPVGISFTTTIVGASMCAGTDIIIACLLCFKFLRMESSTITGRSAHTLVRRVAVIILTSGIIVAAFTLTALLMLVRGAVGFNLAFFCQGRAYTLTILANFLFGVPRRAAVTEVNPSHRTDNSQSVVFRLETYHHQDTHDVLPMPTKSTGNSNSLNSDPSSDNGSNAPHRSLDPLQVKSLPNL